MKIVCAPQSFKGSISASGVANAMADGIRKVDPDAEIILVPVADGGDGTLETLVESTGGQVHISNVTGPNNQKVLCEWGALGDNHTAVIEMARSSGLALVDESDRKPLTATTYGLGEVIKEVLGLGFRNFIIGIGGSATNDGGAGMAQALGVHLLDDAGNEIDRGGMELNQLETINLSSLDSRVSESTFMVACDVNNPLCGPEGASAVYGPQKGATPEMVKLLDNGLSNLAKVIKNDIGIDMIDMSGSGAAGGLGGGLVAFVNGILRPGVDIVLEAVGLKEKMESADLVITGEGQMDFQTVYNKAPIGVGKMAKSLGIPTLGISGSLGKGFGDVHDHGIEAALNITNAPMNLSEANERASELISSATEQALRTMKIGARVFRENI